MATPLRTLKYCVLLMLVAAGILLIYDGRYGFSATLSMPWYSSSNTSLQAGQCHDVLQTMTKGIWKQKRMTSEEVQKMSLFHKRVREEEHNLPKGVQRTDKQCGNISISVKNKWTRALCDSEGNTPCCYENHCVNKLPAECACSNCFDLRIPVHAEYSDWLPVDPVCKPQNWSVEDICRLLEPSTLYFIGDSFIRHVYTALLLAARGNDVTGAFASKMPQELRSRCSGIYMFTEKVCRLWLDQNTRVCNGTVTLRLRYLYSGTMNTSIHKTVLSLQNKTRSLVFLGVGFHNKLNVDIVTKGLLKPLLTAMKSKRLQWPRLVWAPVHQFGMMRTSQTGVDVNMAREFNRRVEEFLTPWGVPVFNTFTLTDNVTSFDGQHYGFGVNRMKVRILLHYLQELKSLGRW
ncbi:uncharacterized protein [Littorina saxatilis]